MEWCRIDVIRKQLKPSARYPDMKIFNQWVNHEIDTKECIRQFRKNNKISDRLVIIDDEFEEWLRTLGYWRYNG